MQPTETCCFRFLATLAFHCVHFPVYPVEITKSRCFAQDSKLLSMSGLDPVGTANGQACECNACARLAAVSYLAAQHSGHTSSNAGAYPAGDLGGSASVPAHYFTPIQVRSGIAWIPVAQNRLLRLLRLLQQLRSVAKVFRFEGAQYIFGGKYFCFIYLKQIFLGTTNLGGAQKNLGDTASEFLDHPPDILNHATNELRHIACIS